MSRKLDFAPLDKIPEKRQHASSKKVLSAPPVKEVVRKSAAQIEEDLVEQSNWRHKRREANPMLQMSIRLPENVYNSFRAYALKERYTNGALFELMWKTYSSAVREEANEDE